MYSSCHDHGDYAESAPGAVAKKHSDSIVYVPKPRVLIISRNLPPLKGGIERLMQNAVAQLGRACDCDVIGPIGCRPYLPVARSVWELPPGLPWFHLRALSRGLLSSKYDLVIAGNGLVAPLAGLAAARNRCPYAVFVHGLDVIAPSRIYQALFVPWIRRAKAIVANSRYTAGLAQSAGVPAKSIRIIHPGVEMPRGDADGGAFRARHQLGARPMLLSVGRLVRRKGIAEFIARAMPLILRQRPDACLVVIGGEPVHAAADSRGTRAAIEAACAGLPAQSVLLLGEVSEDVLGQAYAAANLFVFPVLALPGDVEGFGMVALEAAAYGIATVAFAVGGVADAITPENGSLIAPDDYEAFATAVVSRLAAEAPSMAIAKWAQAQDWEHRGVQLRALANLVHPA